MPPAFIQSKGGTSNTLSSLPVSFTSNNAAGNLLVCSGVVNASGIAGLTITDTQGNTWTIALVDNWKPLSTFFMAYAPNCKAGANTVTIAQLGSLISGAISEYSGVSTVALLDKTGFSDSGASTWTSATSGNVTTRENGELIVAAQANSTGPASVTLGSGFSNLQNDSGNFVSIESQVQATAGLIAGTFTVSASSGACGVLTFVPSGDVAFNVWSPQGQIITNASGNIFSNPNVIYDTNPQILTGNTHVYKMWCNVYSYQGTFGTYYFESVDGLTSWTATSTSVPDLAGYEFITVFKIGSTYYLFGNTATATNIDEYSSADGRTWVLAKANSIRIGGSGSPGSPDQNGAYQPNLIDTIAGTYYVYYTGVDSMGVHHACLATSTDFVNWTKYSGNPIVGIGSGGATNFQKVGGIYYAWQSLRYKNAQLFAASAQSITRYSSSSVTGPWTPLTLNGENLATYYAASPADFNVSGTTLVPNSTATDQQMVATPGGNIIMYYSNAPAGNPTGICAALATSMTFAQLIQTYEGVQNAPISGNPQLNLVTLATDTFQRADGALGSNWTPIATSGGFNASQIVSHLVERNAAAKGDSYWNALSWNQNQWSASTIAAITATNAGEGTAVLMNTSGTASEYTFQWNGIVGNTGTVWAIKKTVSGTGTVLVTNSAFLTLNVGDVIMGVAFNTGAATRLLFYWNGYCIAAFDDTTFNSGAAGFNIAANTAANNAAISAWSGGTFRDAPLLSASISGNAGVGGATVTYSGAASGSVVADSFGNYILPNLVNGSYTITPSLSGYTFSPTSSNQILSGTNITGVNFVATQQSSTTAGPSSGLQSVQLYGRLANGSIIAVSIDINGNLAVSGGTGGAINSVDVLKNGVATPAMVYGVTSAGKLVAVAVDANGNLCCANVGTGGGNSSTTVDIAKYATPTPVQAVGREPISGKLYAVPLNASNSLYDSVHPGATPTSSLTVPGVAPRPVQLCGRAPNGKIIAVALDTSGRLCVSGSGQSGSANAVDAFKNGVPLAIQLFGINSAGKLQPVPLDANGNLELS